MFRSLSRTAFNIYKKVNFTDPRGSSLIVSTFRQNIYFIKTKLFLRELDLSIRVVIRVSLTLLLQIHPCYSFNHNRLYDIIVGLYDQRSSTWYFDIQPVHSKISSPTGPLTLNLTIVVHFGHLPSTLRVFRCGLAVLLFLLPIYVNKSTFTVL